MIFNSTLIHQAVISKLKRAEIFNNTLHHKLTIRILLLATEVFLEFEKLIVYKAERPEDIASMVFKCLLAVTMDKDIPIDISQREKEIQVSR